MKRICVQKANEVEIQFNDRIYTATFNMEAVMHMQEALQDSGVEKISYPHFAAVVLYSGIRVNHEDFTMDEAVALAITMRPADLNSVVDEYVQSINGVSISENEEMLKKTVAQMLGKMTGISM